MRFTPIFILWLFLISCRDDTIRPNTIYPDTLAQTWRFVGVGSHLADMTWNLDGFDYTDAPSLDLRETKRVSGFSGINTYDGQSETTLNYTHTQQLAVGGKITITALSQTKRGGTVAQMQVENQLLTGLQQATDYYVEAINGQYYSLSVSYGNGSAYLYFVSKR